VRGVVPFEIGFSQVTALGLISVWLRNVPQNQDRLSSKRGGSRFHRCVASCMGPNATTRVVEPA
jgi:hypothetical protein